MDMVEGMKYPYVHSMSVMKCEVHPENDAIGTCASCGASVCNECKETHDGILHCRVCVTKGRIVDRPSLDWQSIFYHIPQPKPTEALNIPVAMSGLVHPYPTDEPDARPFKIGKYGALVTGPYMIILALTVPLGRFWLALTFGGAVGLVLAILPYIMGLHGLYRNYGLKWGMYSSVSLALMVLLMLVMGLVTFVTYGPLKDDMFTDVRPLELYLGNGLLGIGFLMTGIAQYKLKDYFLPTTGIRSMSVSVSGGTMVGGIILVIFLLLAFLPILPSDQATTDLILNAFLMIGWLILGMITTMMFFVFYRAPLPERMLDRISDDSAATVLEKDEGALGAQ